MVLSYEAAQFLADAICAKGMAQGNCKVVSEDCWARSEDGGFSQVVRLGDMDISINHGTKTVKDYSKHECKCAGSKLRAQLEHDRDASKAVLEDYVAHSECRSGVDVTYHMAVIAYITDLLNMLGSDKKEEE